MILVSLLRFDPETKQYKEKGLGDVKLLTNETTGKTRIILRRERVHKIALNHFLKETMELTPQGSAGNAWIWYALDFADGEEKAETFAIK